MEIYPDAIHCFLDVIFGDFMEITRMIRQRIMIIIGIDADIEVSDWNYG